MRCLIDRVARNGREWRIIARSDGIAEVWTDTSVLEFPHMPAAIHHVAEQYKLAQDFREYKPGQLMKLNVAGKPRELTVVDNSPQKISLIDNKGKEFSIKHMRPEHVRPEGVEHYRSEQFPAAPEPGGKVDVFAAKDMVTIGYCPKCRETVRGTPNYTMEDHFLDVHGIQTKASTPYMVPNNVPNFGGKRELYVGATQILAAKSKVTYDPSSQFELSFPPKDVGTDEQRRWILNDPNLLNWWRQERREEKMLGGDHDLPLEKFIDRHRLTLNKWISQQVEGAEQGGVFDTKEKESIGYLGPNTYYNADENDGTPDITEKEIAAIAKQEGLDISQYEMRQILMGFEEESKEHDTAGELDVAQSQGDVLRIVLAHLKEDPEYYTKLSNVMGKKAKITGGPGSYHVKSEEGKNLGGPYKTREQAKKRLQQVEYFKHKGRKTADIVRTPYYCRHDHTRLVPHEPSQSRKVCPDCGMVYAAKKILSARDLTGAWSPFDKSPVWPEGGRPKVEWRPYRCKNCGHEKMISTNHLGDVAEYCDNCSWKPSWGNPEYQVPMFGRTYRPFEYAGPTKNTIYSRRKTAQPMEQGNPMDTGTPNVPEHPSSDGGEGAVQQPMKGRSDVGTGRTLSRHELIQEAEHLIYNALDSGHRIGTYDLTQYMANEYGNSPEEILQAVEQAWENVQFESGDELSQYGQPMG